MAEECVTFVDYDKISDLISWLSSEVTLRFNVILSKKGKDGRRYNYHKEYKYDSKCINKEKVYSIKRDFDYYLSFEVKGNMNASIMIRPKDMIALRMRLHAVCKWVSTAFKEDDGKLYLMGKHKKIDITNLSGKYMSFLPVVLEYEDCQKEGIRIFMNGDYFVDITIDTLMELVYVIDGMDMYSAALSVVNYLEKPSYPVNLYEVESNPYDETDTPRLKSNSFFDKM